MLWPDEVLPFPKLIDNCITSSLAKNILSVSQFFEFVLLNEGLRHAIHAFDLFNGINMFLDELCMRLEIVNAIQCNVCVIPKQWLKIQATREFIPLILEIIDALFQVPFLKVW